MPEQGIIIEFARQGAGFIFGLVMLFVWIRFSRDNEKKFEERERRFTEVLRERKNDRDELLRLMGRLDLHLSRSDAFDRFAEEVLNSAAEDGLKRRVLDKKLADSLAKVHGEMHTINKEAEDKLEKKEERK